MTDLLDRSTVVPRRDETVLPLVGEPEPERGLFTLSVAGRTVLALLCGASGLIHLVMVPTHMQQATSEGVRFATAGWIQLALAVWIAVRPTRVALATVIVTNALFLGAWVVSRTTGLPYGAHAYEPESAAFVDLTVVGFEAALIVLALIFAWRPTIGSSWSESEYVVASVIPIAVVALTTAALVAPSTANHAHTTGGDESLVAGDGHTHGEEVSDDRGFSALVNGQEHDGMAHVHEEVPLTREEQEQLDVQLGWTKALVDAYPTLADAKAAGYTESGPFAPGLGLHLMPPGDKMRAARDGVFDTQAEVESAFLIYDGIEDSSRLAGFMYMAYGMQEAPEGFAGPNDQWHFHTNTCVVVAEGKVQAPLGADRSATQEQCDRFGGQLIENTGYMVHVWSVPGYENPDGTFGNLTPAITCPDGSYHMIPDEEIGFVRSLCRA